MEKCAHDAEYAKVHGMRQDVAKHFLEEDEKRMKEDPNWYDNLPDHYSSESGWRTINPTGEIDL